VDCPPLAEPVYVDREMYEKVVLNLLSNAFKFTFEGGIRVSLEADGGNVRLSVSDTGTGIAEAELPHLFERFHRVEGARGRSYEGSGIGLALVNELVKLLGGTISVQSALGKGTTFTVTLRAGTAHLPTRLVQESPAPRPAANGVEAFVQEAGQWLQTPSGRAEAEGTGDLPLPSNDARFGGPQGRVLLVDDHADMREYVRRTLHGSFLVDAVANGEAALERARANPPDVVLSDVMMPGLDGFALLRELRQDPRTEHVPVILLSARAGEEATVEGLSAGATDYLVKPFKARELRARVDGVVRAARAKAERERLLREFEAARNRLNSLFANAPAFVCALRGPKHAFELVNPPYQQLVGTRRKLMGSTVEEAIPEAAQQGFVRLLDEVYRTGEPYIGRETLLRLDRRGEGNPEDAYVNFIYQARRDAQGEIVGIDVFGFEVTEQVLARKKVELLMEQLKVADQRKDEFLAMLAHELRNPLAALSMALSMLERCEGDSPKTARYRDTARRQMVNLVRLVDDLLDVSRITRGDVELRKAAVDLADVIQNALAATRPAIELRGHEMSVRLASGVFRVDADATRLEQVVVNLLTNAVKYTEPGGSLSVRLSRELVDGAPEAVLSVRDTGRGIPRDMLEKVFDMFVQVSPTIDRSTGGLGLGLTLVRRLVEMHGGSVQAHSEGPGKGSEFVVRLPLMTKQSSRYAE
jgi:signal transduction histidine kinase